MPPKTSLKARLARAFLNFLDEHGDYRTELEEAAARAAAAEAGALFAKDRSGRRKKKRRGRGRSKDEDDEDEWDELGSPGDDDEKKDADENKLPEDPYEQIQFYFRTFKQRTRMQVEEQLERYRALARDRVHDELHHPARVPLLSGVMLASIALLWVARARQRKMAGLARTHAILGKKLEWKDYLHPNVVKGRIMLRYSAEGGQKLGKLGEKAHKVEGAALASMRPYQRRRYERLRRLERAWEWCVTGCLLLGVFASGTTLVLSLNGLVRELHGASNNGAAVPSSVEGERLDGHIYSLDGPVDSDGYPMGLREAAEVEYAACLAEAESSGVEDPTTACNIHSFFDVAEGGEADGAAPSSPLRSKINAVLTARLRVPSYLADYLTRLRTQTIAYLSSFATFLLFLLSHYVAHKINVAAVANDPMKHFVLSAMDKSVKADGTVEAKRGETEAQRKRRERALQNERLKAKMAQLAMEAKQRVAERRARVELAERAEKDREEEQKKVSEEQEEIVKCHSRQYMMVKAGVPEGGILNSFLAEGIEEEEGKEIVAKLRAAKERRAKEVKRAEEAEAKKAEEEKMAEEEKERIAAERLRTMKQNGVSFSRSSLLSPATVGGGLGSVASTANSLSSRTSSKTSLSAKKDVDPAAPGPKSVARRGASSSVETGAAPRPGGGAVVAGNLPAGARGDKRWDLSSKAWVAASPNVVGDGAGFGSAGVTPGSGKATPKKSNKTEDGTSDAGHIPSRLKMGEEEEEKKGEEESTATPVGSSATAPAAPAVARVQASLRDDGAGTNAAEATRELHKPLKHPVATTLAPPAAGPAEDENQSSGSSSIKTPVLVRISLPDDDKATPSSAVPPPPSPPSSSSIAPGNSALGALSFGRPSARDIRATIAAVENVSETPQEDAGSDGGVDLAPAWMHSPAFEAALRNSNASWDRRPSSRDVAARIRAVEEYEEAQKQEAETEAEGAPGGRVGLLPHQGHRLSHVRTRGLLPPPQGEESLAIIDEGRNIDPASSFEFRRTAGKAGENGSDDEISELSEPSYLTSETNAMMYKGRSIPQALELSPMVSPTMSALTALSPPNARRKVLSKDRMEKLAGEMPEPQKLGLLSGMQDADEEEEPGAASKSKEKTAVVKAETEEERKRRERAEARTKKMEAITARRNAGKDDDESAVSGISKRHRMRRKKKLANKGTTAVPEEGGSASVTSSGAASEVIPVKGQTANETEAECKRKMRAEARAKKLAAMAHRRNVGKDEDDGTAVTGISRRHRMRRKKSALAAIDPVEHERKEWRKGIFASVLNAERSKWKRRIYGHALNAEATRNQNLKERCELEERDAAARRKLEHQRRLDEKAKKFAARAERFHKIRREGNDGDDSGSVTGSVISSASKHRRRRRSRKSVASRQGSLMNEPVGEEAMPVLLTAKEKDRQEREQWCSSIFATVLQADQLQWKKNIFGHVIHAEEAQKKRLEMEAKIAKERATAKARKEKERKDELRAKKMEKMKLIRGAGDVESRDDDDQSVASAVSSSSLKKMRNRRRKAARKSMSKKPPLSSQATVGGAVLPLAEEETAASTEVIQALAPTGLTVEEREQQEREQWCSSIFGMALQAEQCQWKNNIYQHVLRAEKSRNERWEIEARLATERARREKERRDELRAKKMERMKQIRDAGGTDENATSPADANEDPTSGSTKSVVGNSIGSDMSSGR